ncbi:MAG: NAD-dependent epimerase/dehydratase family protein [Actinobacteria bacterium]|nr:NAD-dependent epimerase/dehydratase family protein [Actinomycetota bacterium]
MARVVLVTGAARHLGGQMTRALAKDPFVERVIGVDVVPPRKVLGEAEFIRADIRNPVIGKIIRSADVDTVVHMGVIATPVQAGGRAAMKEINVIGTMQLLAACQKSETVRRLVVKSTTSVYGAGPRDPALFTEGMAPKHPPTSGWAKDLVEVEGYVRGFGRRRPDVDVTILRLANFIGPRIQTAMTSYFSLPVVPTVMGYDARLQFVHEDDGIEALRVAAASEATGVFNVAGEGIITLSQAIRRAGRPWLEVPRPLLGFAGRSLGSRLADFSPDQVRFLTYGRGIDTGRAAHVLGFIPRYTTARAFDDFVRGHGLREGFTSRVVEATESAVFQAAAAAQRLASSAVDWGSSRSEVRRA